MRKIRRKREKRNRKIIIISVLVFLLIMTSGYAAFSTNISLHAKANIKEKPQDESCFEYQDNGDGTATINGYHVDTCGTDVNIPSKINNLTVTKIGNGSSSVSKSFSNMGLTSVVIPDSVLRIEDFAFFDNDISKLTLSKNLNYIGQESFNHNLLTELVIPDSVTYIRDEAFEDNLLTYINLPKSVKTLETAVFVKNNLPEESPIFYGIDGNGNIDYTVLNSCAKGVVNNLKIPETVKTIGYRSFRSVTVNNLTITSNVETINSEAFVNAKLNNITIEEGLKEIKANVFRWMIGPTEITLPQTISKIDELAFNSSGFKVINIKKTEGSISGEPWGATNAEINWIG